MMSIVGVLMMFCVFAPATNSKRNHTLCGLSAPKEERASIVAFVYAFLKEVHVGTKVAKLNFITFRRIYRVST